MDTFWGLRATENGNSLLARHAEHGYVVWAHLSAKVCAMPAGAPGRSRRRAKTPLVEMKVRVEAPTRDRAGAAAAALGISVAHYIELLVSGDVFDEQGRPIWAPDVLPDLPNPIPGIDYRGAA